MESGEMAGMFSLGSGPLIWRGLRDVHMRTLETIHKGE